MASERLIGHGPEEEGGRRAGAGTQVAEHVVANSCRSGTAELAPVSSGHKAAGWPAVEECLDGQRLPARGRCLRETRRPRLRCHFPPHSRVRGRLDRPKVVSNGSSRWWVDWQYLDEILAFGFCHERLEFWSGESVDEAGFRHDEKQDLGSSEDGKLVGLGDRGEVSIAGESSCRKRRRSATHGEVMHSSMRLRAARETERADSRDSPSS